MNWAWRPSSPRAGCTLTSPMETGKAQTTGHHRACCTVVLKTKEESVMPAGLWKTWPTLHVSIRLHFCGHKHKTRCWSSHAFLCWRQVVVQLPEKPVSWATALCLKTEPESILPSAEVSWSTELLGWHHSLHTIGKLTKMEGSPWPFCKYYMHDKKTCKSREFWGRKR